ncbi:SHOCT domain-containing protein [Microbacterium fluvii]|uniref:SHOCT domain-containing protein n=1 Tax=Microbacterium fluvii TaxID=415215 RepID=A0ABW2HHK5_9MICO|nr:SHOCT domain-containing protein [Microbacterium fluvii]MCU4672838.1 SHOCT domain-containing protein [Microbacterium fluvii]
MDLWSWIAWFFWCFVFIAYLMALFSILSDIFRDSSLNGWLKAVWIIFLIFVPFLTALVYLIARGDGMSRRSMAQARALREDQDAYIRATAGSGSSIDDIAKAKTLLDSGAISQAEFDAIKAKALA